VGTPAAPAPGKLHPRNQLNELTGKQWIRFTRSWVVHNPPRRSASQIQHPAKYPEALAAEFVEFFTKPGQRVLDPFMGVGSTLLAAEQAGRVGVGLELNPRYFELAGQHVPTARERMFNQDAALAQPTLAAAGLAPVDFVLTSPPYWDMLGQSRGNVYSAHKARKASGLDVVYSADDTRDLGNIADYATFVDTLAGVFGGVARVLRRGGYMVVVIQNLRSPEGRMVTLAWDLTARLEAFMTFKGERIWCQDNKQLGIWGYPSEFVSNVHHHYCLIFKNDLLPPS
jgi:DNA modification methylase